MKRNDPRKEGEPNRDPISKAPGSHPLGTGAGAAAGGTAGAAAGTVLGGPVGAVAGAAVGAVVGGLMGKGLAEAVDPTEEDAYWRGQHRHEPYYAKERDYDFYAPAYRAGYEGRVKYDGRRYDEIEDDLAADYARLRGADLDWDEVRPATRAAWERVDRRVQDLTRN